jgi:hypothetical protein
MAARMILRTAGVAPAALNRRSAVVVRASEQPVQTPAPAEQVVDSLSVQAAEAVPTPVAAAVSTGNKTVSFTDAMAFANPVGPETINGRLAMIGVLAAIGAELSTGESFFTQFEAATPVVLATWAVIALASLVPVMKGADVTQAFGPLTQKAEMANGRAAMLGIAGLLIVELAKGSALF